MYQLLGDDKMTFKQLKEALREFGLLEYIDDLYSPEGMVKDYDLLDQRLSKLSSSQALLIGALTDIYHNRQTVYFMDLVNVLDETNRAKISKLWDKNFKGME